MKVNYLILLKIRCVKPSGIGRFGESENGSENLGIDLFNNLRIYFGLVRIFSEYA